MRKKVEPVPDLAKQVTRLARLVDDLAAKMAARPVSGAAPSWLDLPEDLAVVRMVLGDLTGWMRDVLLRYPDAVQSLPECWMWHPDVVEELLWLMYAWIAAYRDEDATVARAGDWHDRYRPGVVKRIKATAGTCSLDNHRPGAARHTAGAPVPLAEALAPITEWWATGRGRLPPEPTEEQLAAAAAMPRRSGGGRR